MHYRITMVHGTFAKGAPWTQDNSRLSTALRAGLEGTVEIERCEWGGGNTAGSRMHGAKLLADHLRAQGDKLPNERRFVVAHSHGGNVALYALRDPAVINLLDGVVCMATPFLVARRRDLGPKGTENILLVLFLAILASDYLLIEPRLAALVGELGAFAGMTVVMVIAMLALAQLFRQWSRMADGLLETLRLAELPSQKLLILRATGDEASALLLFFQFLSLLAVRLFHSLQRMYAALERLFTVWAKKKVALLAVAVGGFLLPVGLVLLLLDSGWAMTRGMAIGLAIAIAVMVVLPMYLFVGWIGPSTAIFRFLASLALVPAALVLALCMLPIDWRVALANLLVDVTVEAAPPGAWMIHQLVPEPSSVESRSVPAFSHSAVYDDQRAIRAIVERIRHSSGDGDEEALLSAHGARARSPQKTAPTIDRNPEV